MLAFLLLAVGRVSAANPAQFFEEKIRPALIEHCYECHSSKAELLKAEFLLDTREGIRKGGMSGRDAIIPGDVDSSQLIEAIRYTNAELQMPPDGKLPDQVIADFETWVAMGAQDPRDGISQKPSELAAKEHWAFQPIQNPPPPKPKDSTWPRDPVDHFTLAAMARKKLTPVTDADPLTLLRRLTYDLTGLPPTVAEQEEFLRKLQTAVDQDGETGKHGDTEKSSNGKISPSPSPPISLSSPAAQKVIEQTVDSLLASEAFGQKWGRHWLDIARYAESSGYARNMLVPDAWRFRNYVIDAFNKDKPYDQFLREQLAGDQLPAKDPAQKDEQAIATGFLSVGPKTMGEGQPLLFHLNAADDQIDATCRTFLALTANCSRCHDHKYDPIPTADYYALAGIFLSSRHYAGTETNNRNEHGAQYALGPGGQAQFTAIDEFQKKADAEQAKYMAAINKRKEIYAALEAKNIDWKKNPSKELIEADKVVRKHYDIVQALNKGPKPQPPEMAVVVLDGEIAPPPPADPEKAKQATEAATAELSAEEKKAAELIERQRVFIADSPIYEKGLHDSPAEDKVPRGVLTLFNYDAPPIPEDASGRLQLAEWLLDERNPLTARVIVNRVWRQLFGRGLVETVDNFGVLGAKPSHPELLDHLATRFRTEHQWSFKALIHDLMMTRTYQLSAATIKTNNTIDEGNVYLWRHRPRLIDAEALRDSVLAVAGELDPVHLEGSQVSDVAATQPKLQQREVGRRDFFVAQADYDVTYRSVYLPIVRASMPDALTLFDVADPNLVVGQRRNTAVPTQALYLMNNPFVVKRAEKMAGDLLADTSLKNNADRTTHLYQTILARPPTADEISLFENYLEQATTEASVTWSNLAHTLIQSGEFRILY
jgi:hypothetical protein